jgi:hypothetical protein
MKEIRVVKARRKIIVGKNGKEKGRGRKKEARRKKEVNQYDE